MICAPLSIHSNAPSHGAQDRRPLLATLRVAAAQCSLNVAGYATMKRTSITYRELRNTPGRVFERLNAGEPLPFVAEGETKALLIPVEGGDVDTALEAWRRGRALVALGRLQAQARATGRDSLTSSDIADEVRAARGARRARER